MHPRRPRPFLAVALGLAAACTGRSSSEPPVADTMVTNQRIVYSDGLHNENTEMIQFGEKIVLIFRGGETGQKASGKSHINVYASTDDGASFTKISQVEPPKNPSVPGELRDIRDPKLMLHGDRLDLYAISRKTTGLGYRDLEGDAWTVRASSTDGGVTWSTPVRIFEERGFGGLEHPWGFWRFTERHFVENGTARQTLYATAYDDGDVSVGFFQSDDDGDTWQKRSILFSSYPDVPSETELQFLGPNATTAVALVRLDNQGILFDGQTAICTSAAPFDEWHCDRRIEERIDGPTWVVRNDHGRERHFVFARKHLSCTRKRTAVYELRGDLTDPSSPVEACEIQTLQSAGDTAYTSLAPLDPDRSLLAWYSTPPDHDVAWLNGTFSPSDIWLADVDFRAAPDSCAPAESDEPCEPQPLPAGTAQDVSGRHLLALAPVIWPQIPVLFEANLGSHDGRLDLALQPLEPAGLSPVGDPWNVSGVPVGNDGHFDADFGTQSLPGATFPALGAPIPIPIHDLHLSGVEQAGGLVCGNVDGEVVVLPTSSDRFSIQGSTFGAVAWPSGTAAPTPVATCS